MKHSWNILSGSSTRISGWIALGGAHLKERGGEAAPSPPPLQGVTTEFKVCTHLGLEERQRDKPPECCSWGLPKCWGCSVLDQCCHEQHTGKSSPTPVSKGLPSCRRARWASRAELHALGKLSSPSAFPSLLGKVVILGRAKMWQPSGSNPQQGMACSACPYGLSLSISTVPPDKHSSHQKFIFNKLHRLSGPSTSDFVPLLFQHHW